MSTSFHQYFDILFINFRLQLESFKNVVYFTLFLIFKNGFPREKLKNDTLKVFYV